MVCAPLMFSSGSRAVQNWKQGGPSLLITNVQTTVKSVLNHLITACFSDYLCSLFFRDVILFTLSFSNTKQAKECYFL